MKTATKRTSGSEADSKAMLEEYFLDSLRDIYWAEKHLVKALPKMQKAATSEDLAQAIGDHVAVTEEHVARLEQVFEMMEQKARAKKCEAMEGLIKEGETVISETEKAQQHVMLD